MTFELDCDLLGSSDKGEGVGEAFSTRRTSLHQSSSSDIDQVALTLTHLTHLASHIKSIASWPNIFPENSRDK